MPARSAGAAASPPAGARPEARRTKPRAASRVGSSRMGLPDLTDALQIRRRQRRRRRGRRAAWIGLCAGLLAAAIWLIWFSSVFTVQSVRVEGNNLVGRERLLQAAQVPQGVPLARLDTQAIVGRLDELPTVASARVQRGWPHTAVIQVTERSAIYQRQDAGGYQWVADNGMVFYTTPEPKPETLVVTTPSVDARLLADVALVVQAIPAQVRPRVQSLQADSRDHIVLLLDNNQQVIWGGADHSAEKAAVLPTILTLVGTVYDVSAPAYPAVR